MVSDGRQDQAVTDGVGVIYEYEIQLGSRLAGEAKSNFFWQFPLGIVKRHAKKKKFSC